MARQLTISVTKGSTKIKEVLSSGKINMYASKENRDLEIIDGGIKIAANPNYAQLNNFKILISELTNDGIDFTGVDTSEKLIDKLAENEAFKQGGGLGVDEINQLIESKNYVTEFQYNLDKGNVQNSYVNVEEMYANIVEQLLGNIQHVTGTDTYYEYLGTNNGNATDYRELTVDEYNYFIESINALATVAKTGSYNDLIDKPTLLPFPAPFLEDLVPDSNLPGISGKIILMGSYFKKEMCLAENINTVNGILLQGQTILNAKFISDNRIDLDVTNSTIEGSYDITLNNGLSITYSDVYLLVLGTVVTPIPTDYSNITGAVDITEGENILVSIANTSGSLKCDLQLDINDDFTYSFRWKASPLNPNPTAQQDYIIFKDSVTNSQIFKLRSYNNGGTYIYNSTNGLIKVFENAAHNFNTDINYKIKRTGTILQLMLDSTVAHTFDASVNDLVVNNLIVEHITQKLDRLAIRYISHNL